MVSLNELTSHIEAAFADVPRPANDDLLWERCIDDGDIAALYEIDHWRDVPDIVLVNNWGGLYFLSPAGFRHFLPAYLLCALRHAGEGYAVTQSAILALTPTYSEEKFIGFNRRECAAVVLFLEYIASQYSDNYPEVWEALEHWSDALARYGEG